MSLSEFDEIRQKKHNRLAYALVIVAGVGMLFIGVPYFTPSHYALRVNGEEIGLDRYQHVRTALQSQHNNLSDENLRQEALRQLVQQTVLAQHALKSPYNLPESELYRIVKAEFGDSETYRQRLTAMRTNPQSYEAGLRQQENISRYYQILASEQSLGGPLQQQFWQDFAQQRSYDVLTLPMAAALERVEASAEAVQKYYDAHQQDYYTPETVDISYVLINPETLAKTLSAEALKEAGSRRAGKYLLFSKESDANAARERLNREAGAWDELAGQIKSKAIDGEVGDFPLQDFGQTGDKAMDEALFALEKAGAVSPVVKSDYGYVLIQLDKIQDLDAAAAAKKLINEEKIYAVSSSAAEKVEKGATLAEVATLIQGEPEKISGLAAGQNHPIFSREAVKGLLFGEGKLAEGKISDPINIDGGTLFFTIEKRAQPQLQPLETVREKVALDYKTAEAEKALLAEAEALRQELLTSGKSATEISGERQLALQHYENLSRLDTEGPLAPAVLDQLFQSGDRVSLSRNDKKDVLINVLTAVRSGSTEAVPEALRTVLDRQWASQQLERNMEALAKYLVKNADVRVSDRLMQEQ